MAQMNRNVNVEEIGSDAPLGISILNYQTPGQKAILIISILIGIALYVVNMFILHVNTFITIVSLLIPLSVGVLFGCNYNEDFSLIKYFKLIIFKPSYKLYSKPFEDIKTIKNKADELMRLKEADENKNITVTPEMQKKMLIKLAIGISAFIVIIIGIVLVCVFLKNNENEIHHMISMNRI